jgi:ribosomal protein S26
MFMSDVRGHVYTTPYSGCIYKVYFITYLLQYKLRGAWTTNIIRHRSDRERKREIKKLKQQLFEYHHHHHHCRHQHHNIDRQGYYTIIFGAKYNS